MEYTTNSTASNNFYVEVQYDAVSNKIMGKLPFKQGEPLEKYLINLPLF